MAKAQVSIWYDQKSGSIHLAIPETGWFHTTVNRMPRSKRCHENLFMKLARYLDENDVLAPDQTGVDAVLKSP